MAAQTAFRQTLPRYDVAILGAGAAGCVLAARLSEDPDRQVCLVEAGPDHGPYAEGRWPEDLLDARRVALSHAWTADRDDRSQLRARVVGGCSAHNACIALRGIPADYDEWPGWSYAELEPYLRRAEETLGVRSFADEELSPWHRAWIDAGRAAGLSGGAHPVNARGALRWHVAFAYLDPARDRPNLTIRPATLVDRVEPDRGRVLTADGSLEADLIVLAAGAYGSPGILLRSGIGPGLEHDLSVGEELTDHVGVGFSWAPTERLVAETRQFETTRPLFGPQQSLWTAQQETFVLPWNEWSEEGLGTTAVVFVMKPHSRGRVSLNGPAPEEPLRIDHRWLSDERDREALLRGVELVRELASTLGDSVEAEVRPGAGADLGAYVDAEVRGFFHPVGTCGIGRVVEPDGRVRGLDGLYVGDASVMPTIPRANTQLSTVALAERIAEQV
ncbi:MAG TPA: GMC family oxidoreductase [Gaiellaceae bacterium]|nr:GMC family oxidoreductase [Gaiellaceae bacterium]